LETLYEVLKVKRLCLAELSLEVDRQRIVVAIEEVDKGLVPPTELSQSVDFLDEAVELAGREEVVWDVPQTLSVEPPRVLGRVRSG